MPLFLIHWFYGSPFIVLYWILFAIAKKALAMSSKNIYILFLIIKCNSEIVSSLIHILLYNDILIHNIELPGWFQNIIMFSWVSTDDEYIIFVCCDCPTAVWNLPIYLKFDLFVSTNIIKTHILSSFFKIMNCWIAYKCENLFSPKYHRNYLEIKWLRYQLYFN